MKLQELLKDVAVTEVHADLETEVASIVYDSRKAEPETVFVCMGACLRPSPALPLTGTDSSPWRWKREPL